jgi:hypothetical protein
VDSKDFKANSKKSGVNATEFRAYSKKSGSDSKDFKAFPLPARRFCGKLEMTDEKTYL